MAFAAVGAFPSFGYGRLTATAGTVIQRVIPGKRRLRTKMTRVVITCAATAHTMTIQRPQARVLTSAAAAAAQAVIKLASDPGKFTGKTTANNLIAANHFLILEYPDRTQQVAKVSSVVTNSDGTVTVTLTANVATGGLPSGSNVWFMGAVGDTDPNTALAFENYLGVVNVSTTFDNPSGGTLAESFGLFEPLLLSDNNATNAGSIDEASGMYGP